MDRLLDGVGVVVIGRNEGHGLARTLDALPRGSVPVVYVDSGSTDGSPAHARARGVPVVELDPGTPFSAARGRNEGLAWLIGHHPGLELVQFVDGDTELVASWLETATAAMRRNIKLGAVDGRLREREPHASFYNRACDVEWELVDAGHTLGTAMFRVEAFREVGGFRADLPAGEEPELCVRLRARGWVISRLPEAMALHDVGLGASGWWERCKRAGRAYAEGATLHGDGEEKHWAWEHQRAILGGVVLPAAAVALAVPTLGVSVLGLVAGGVISWTRAYRHARAREREAVDAAAWATACVVGRLAEGQGALAYHRDRWRDGLRSTAAGIPTPAPIDVPATPDFQEVHAS